MLVPPRTRARLRGVLTTFLVCSLCTPWGVNSAACAEPGQPDFTQLTIEQLLHVEVTSVAKKEQKLANAAAAHNC